MTSSLYLSVDHALQCLYRPDRIRGIVFAASGGPDSTALLYLSAPSCSRYRLAPTVVYVDHGLRPEEAPAEEALVRRHAARLDMECRTCRVDAAGYARQQSLSLEHAARDLRYGALAEVAQEQQADSIVVGHTSDDQVEGVLLRLLRGGGRTALSGMPAVGLEIVRPLLEVSKQELLDFLHRENLAYCIDSSNRDTRFLRNRIRHHLLPLLEQQYDSGVRRALLKTAAIFREEDSLLAQLADEAWQEVAVSGSDALEDDLVLDRRALAALHPAIQRRVVEKALHQCRSAAKYSHILEILRVAERGGGRRELHLSRGLRAVITRESITLSYPRGRGPWRGKLPRE